ncbi:hypothetical protein Aph01nite_36560 [Acrocarpospora phusangensis]|uniref:Uncharacterized protein n=1 Tax=Acrocarpospora phusangensis TaxID=1070424 RepID=A0A919QAP2_9ACTN|nr:hypothetical protein [Acrocarpospora phusangensis]GIH25346.1 hypothetical protein Aph01nite_36560 [Acrocarpospora phusangensis]
MNQQVTAALKNADGTSNIYITRDPTVNALTLTLTNGLGAPIVFPPGTPVADGSLPAGQSAIYVYLNGYIDNADIAAFEVSAPGWKAATFADANDFQYLVIAPVSQVSVPQGGALSFRLGNVLVSGQPISGNADIDLAGAQGVTDDQADVPLFLNIANPPQPGLKTLPLKIDFNQPSVYAGVPQQLTLHLVNPGDAVLVPGGTGAWQGHTPTFQLTFVYGDGPGALTTVPDAAQIAMSIGDAYGNVWQPPQRHVQGQGPYWIMQPDPDGGGTVLGSGGQGIIEFALTGIEATLPGGLDEALTLAYVSWHSVPGYNDGSTTVIITKKPGPEVLSFSATPPVVPYGQATVQTVLTWATDHTTGARFDAPGIASGQNFAPSGSGPITGGIRVGLGTRLTLIAYKDISGGEGDSGRKGRSRGGRGRKRASEELIASAVLDIGGVTRGDVATGLPSLGGIVVPKGAGKAFLFQINIGMRITQPLTRGAVLDLATLKVTGGFDVGPIIPPSRSGGTLINAAAAGPDGKTIHLIASSGNGDVSRLSPDYSILPLDVGTARLGKPVGLDSLAPSGQPSIPYMLVTGDGKTVFIGNSDMSTRRLCVAALDPATYAVRNSWVAPADPALGMEGVAAVSPDGGKLLLAGFGGLAVVDVANGFVTKDTLYVSQRLRVMVANQVVTADFTRAYCFCVDSVKSPAHGSLLTVDIDPVTGALALVSDTPLGLTRTDGPILLSADEDTLYLNSQAGTLTAMDTATLQAIPYGCGDFTPLLVANGSAPGILLATGANGVSTDTISVITIH